MPLCKKDRTIKEGYGKTIRIMSCSDEHFKSCDEDIGCFSYEEVKCFPKEKLVAIYCNTKIQGKQNKKPNKKKKYFNRYDLRI